MDSSTNPGSQVIAFVSPSLAASNAAALTFAAAQPDGVDDVKVLTPAEGRWKVDDLDAVIAAAAMRPVVRNLLVIERADDMTDLVVARLLKTFEEPAAPTWFLLCVRTVASMPVPVQGRIHTTVTVASPDVAVVVEELAAAGVTREEAEAIGLLCHPRTELAPYLTRSVAEMTELMSALRWPVDAAQVSAACAGIDRAAKSAKPSKVKGADLDRWRTALKRDLANLVIDRWRAATSKALLEAVQHRRPIGPFNATAGALDRAESLLERDAPVQAAFSAAVRGPGAGI
jgi:DNA polymerase III delta prime subunit